MPSAVIPTTLPEVRAALERMLHCSGNMGDRIHQLALPGEPAAAVLMLYIQGMAEEGQIQQRAVELLAGLSLATGPGRRARSVVLSLAAPTPWARVEPDLSRAISRVVDGDTALFFEGAGEAVVVETQGRPEHAAGAAHTYPPKDLFSRDLMENLALVRKRLRDQHLVAEPQTLQGGTAGRAALVYMEGRADPEVLRRVREWVQRHGEETIRLGHLAGPGSNLGLLPTMTANAWPDKVATALDAGYVALLADQVHLAWVAPVTAPLLLYGPSDETMARPLTVIMRFIRLGLALFALLAMAGVVALMNYHQEMMPTPFLLALAAVRENAPFPVMFEVLIVELLQEIIREVGFNLPLRMGPGPAIIAGKLLVLLLVQAGLVSPLPGLVSVTVAFVVLGFHQYETIYLLRIWRLIMLVGAAALGFYGMSVVLFCMIAYLFQADSFGVPFIGETGLRFTTQGITSSWLGRGGQRDRGKAIG